MLSSQKNARNESPVIAFYCSSTSWGGLEMNTVRYAAKMSSLGWSVLFFCVSETPIYNNALQYSLHVIAVKRNHKYFDLVNAIRVKKLFDQKRVTLCWFRDTRDFSLLGLVKRLMSGRLKLLYQQAMQFGVSKKDPLHTLRFIPVDAWVSTLHFLAEQVREQTHFPHNRIHVVPLGVDMKLLHSETSDKSLSRKKLNLPSDAFIIGIIGRLDPLKGQHVSIEALRILHQEGKECHLLVFGESTLHEGSTYENSIKQKVIESGLAPFVHFRPFSRDVHHFYSAIDAFVLCSKGETFGMVTIEAMSFEKPILATNSSGTPEILKQGECGILYEPEDASALAQHLKQWIENPDAMHAIGAKALIEFNRQYTLDISIKRMESIVLSIL